MKLCNACDRHLFGDELHCPFCGERQSMVGAGPITSTVATVTLALGLGLGTVACGPQIVDVDEPIGPATSVADTGETTAPVPPWTTTSTTTQGDGPMTSTSTTNAESDAADDFPCGFYGGCDPDGGIVAFECDVFAQDCPEGEKCMPWANDGGGSWNATRCSPIAPDPGQPGDSCIVEGSGVSGIDDCDIGVMCFDVDPETNQGVCVAMCTGSPGMPMCAEPGTACAIANDGAIALCLPACNPLLGDCDAGKGCYPVRGSFFCLDTSTGGAYGDACEFITSCDPGLTCIGAAGVPNCMGVGCCTEYCDTSLMNECPDIALGVECVPWFEEGAAPAGFETLGACGLPP